MPASAQFVVGLRKIKEVVIVWGREKQRLRSHSLAEIELEPTWIHIESNTSVIPQHQVDHIQLLEQERVKFLLDQEREWRLKSRALWLSEGKDNTIFFHKFSNYMMNINKVWKMPKEDGSMAYRFEEITQLGGKHF